MSDVNVDLLDEVMDFIRMNPERHSQSAWVLENDLCGTTCCFAGWTGVIAGTHEVRLQQSPWADGMTPALFNLSTGIFDRTMQEPAAELLRLNEAQTWALFFLAQSFDAVELVVKEIKNGNLNPTPALEEYYERIEAEGATLL